ncbi:MAG: hypothetical protein K8R76_12375 [Candidatus Aegiribacteria sp.]|nr:hypothetical protein [Candidatus Aegiribacteria sp.]
MYFVFEFGGNPDEELENGASEGSYGHWVGVPTNYTNTSRLYTINRSTYCV